jgi:hypothetical protein
MIGGKMTELKYAANIVTTTREYTKEEMKMLEEFSKKHPVESTVKAFRLLWMDNNMVAGASMYMECVWLWEGKTTSGTTEQPHVHEFDEVIGFISTDKENPGELDARMEIILGDETHYLTKSCLVHVPAGMKHCPLTFREVNRPVFFFTLAPVSRYGRQAEGMKPPGQVAPVKTNFVPPEKPDASGTKYGRYIITRVKPKKFPPRKGPPTAETMRVVSLDDDMSKGAIYAEFVWVWSGTTTMAPQGHAHDWDEMIGIIGSDRENPRDLGGEVSIMLGDEKHNLTQSSLIFVPGGLYHCPLEFKNIKIPVLCFTLGNTVKYTIKD